MTAGRLFVVVVCVGLVVPVTAAILALVEPQADKPHRTVVDLLVGGLFLGFVAAVTVAYIGATLP